MWRLGVRSTRKVKSSHSVVFKKNQPELYHNFLGSPRFQQHRHCGLVAAISLEPSSTSLESIDIVHATNTLSHRGPDGQQTAKGTMMIRESKQQVPWVMGHTRLAIVDPNSRTADMPFRLQFHSTKKMLSGDTSNAQTTAHLVANGEIYNHGSLYKTLVDQYGWNNPRNSQSDCEVIAHACVCMEPEQAVKQLDGMFAFVLFTETIGAQENSHIAAFAARDPVGIKPLYYGRTLGQATQEQSSAGAYVFASELKALVGQVEPSTVRAIPPGHYWTPETGLVRYHRPAWLHDPNFAPWEDPQKVQPSDEEIREAFKAAVAKRMMADVDYGFFLSGGIDSCIVSHVLLPMYRKETGDDRPIPAFTVGMEDSPDMQAAKAMVEALGGPRYVDHRKRIFTGKDVFDLIPKIVYHMETYEAELIRSAIPNWLLAERAGADVKMVLTGEGADELFAGYLYFMDAETPQQIQNELKRIYSMLGDINLHRTDRMTMAHGLEARVPFLDTKFTELVMSLNPAVKIVDRDAVSRNANGREKSFLRNLFQGPNSNGSSIPHPVLWRAKAMQCEGVGEDWVSQLQRRVAAEVSDAEMASAGEIYPLNTPQTKEELYYRRLFDDCFAGMAHVVNPWEGGCRAAGAAWTSQSYTREGLANTSLLTHAFQKKSTAAKSNVRLYSNTPIKTSTSPLADNEFILNATNSGYEIFEAFLTVGGDDRSLINTKTGTNKYHIRPRPIDSDAIFRGSCTCNAPTQHGYLASEKLFEKFQSSKVQKWKDMLRAVMEDQRQRISKCLDLPEGTEVVLCPSGSDAEYIPIAIARALNPSSKIVNIVTQLQEIGAGSSIASGGCYFSTHVPLMGRLPESEGSNGSTCRRLEGFDNVTEISIPARNRDGSVVDASKVALDLAYQHAHESNGEGDSATANSTYTIVHGVFGGKTGLRDVTMPKSDDAGHKSLGVIDACQGRFTTQELKSWLDQDSIVLFTASKFYQAPPFCGAVLIPARVAKALRQSSSTPSPKMLGPLGLGGFLTDLEVPPCLDSWKPHLVRQHDETDDIHEQSALANIGLALRWEAGLAGMEALANHPECHRQDDAVKEWSDHVTNLIESPKVSHNMDAWCVERSIVSIRLKRSSGDWMDMKELKDVYRYMSMDVSEGVPESVTPEERAILAVGCNLGQPVDVADSHAVLRIALGSESLLRYLENPDEVQNEDEIVVQKLSLVAKYLSSLQMRIP
jgi:asparagine synthase (glutamine-hydrolysing)